MQERVFSLETEYAISFRPEQGGTPCDASEIVEALRKPLVKKCGIAGSAFLQNGGKFHHDVGHAEWSLPECRTAREAVLYDKAADRWLAELIPEAEKELSGSGNGGKLLVIKNNVDAGGHTYGCHENYLTECETPWLSREEQLRLTVRYLIPFLVTRQIFCGAGRAGCGARLEEEFGFQIMQRADFIEEAVSKNTTDGRAIVNIGRETEPLASGNCRRLHLILGDANTASWATWLKLGTVGLLLQMVEELGFGEIPHLADPVEALRRISRDPTCRTTVRLRSGEEASALDIQRIYLSQAKDYAKKASHASADAPVIQAWESTLDALGNDPATLFGKVDWVTKKCLMDRYLEKRGLPWGEGIRGQQAYFDLLRMDIQYHDVVPADGLYHRATRSMPDPLFTEEEVRQAMTTPPPFTRAKVRGETVSLARELGIDVDVDSWEELSVQGWEIEMGDPLEFCIPEIYALPQPSLEESADQPEASVAEEPTSAPVDQNLSRRLRSIVVEQLGVEVGQVTAEARFTEDLGADSLDAVELVMAMEEEFGFEIADEDAERLTTVGSAARFLERKLSLGLESHPPPQAVPAEATDAPQTTRGPGSEEAAAPQNPLRRQRARDMADSLVRALEDGDANIQRRAIESLGAIGDAEHVPSLAGMTASVQTEAIRLAAIQALGQIGGQAAIDALTELYHDANLAVRWRSREALTCLLDCRTLPQRRPRPDYQGDSLVRILQ